MPTQQKHINKLNINKIGPKIENNFLFPNKLLSCFINNFHDL